MNWYLVFRVGRHTDEAPAIDGVRSRTQAGALKAARKRNWWRDGDVITVVLCRTSDQQFDARAKKQIRDKEIKDSKLLFA